MIPRSEDERSAREGSDRTNSRPGFIERGIAAAYRTRSLESRAGSVLSLAVVCVLGVGLLEWYYGVALERPAHAAEEARTLAASRAQAEMPLPPLSIPPPAAKVSHAPSSTGAASESNSAPRSPNSDASVVSAAGRAPMAISPWLAAYVPPSSAAVPLVGSQVRDSSAGTNPRPRALERRLAGPAFLTRSGNATTDEAGAPNVSRAQAPESAAAGELSKLLMPEVTRAVSAQVLPTRTLLLPKGAFIDCTLETAIDSTLPGMTTCITATDTFGADGKVVLLERGSKLVGETRGEVSQASSRVFVLWTEARTPTGVVIPLASPGTDELGRSGLPGTVNRHFFERFGAALLISIIDAGAQAAAAARSGAVIYSPTTSQDVMSEVLKDTLRISPTIVKSQGDRIQVLVARDLDFRSVYELRAQNHER